METIDFYFSFRSPYAWLAFHRVERVLEGLPVQLRPIPVFPMGTFPNDPAAVPLKLQYIIADVARIATAYGLPVRPPASTDTVWMRPHAAYLQAEDAGRGRPFALALYRARFSDARDVGADDALADAARAVELDPAAIVRAADDPTLHQRVLAGMKGALDAGIFGVPTFIYRGEMFWGNDRLEWLRRAIEATAGRPVPDLAADPTERIALGSAAR